MDIETATRVQVLDEAVCLSPAIVLHNSLKTHLLLSIYLVLLFMQDSRG